MVAIMSKHSYRPCMICAHDCDKLKPAPSTVCSCESRTCVICMKKYAASDSTNPELSAREWTLSHDSNFDGPPIITDGPDISGGEQEVRVIEHSAYLKLERELAEYKKENAQWSNRTYIAEGKLVNANVKVAGLCEALSDIIEPIYMGEELADDAQALDAIDSIAREALKRFGDGK